jgi:hypothetical protein
LSSPAQAIHSRTADEVARRKAEQVADWSFSHVLRPIREIDDDN